MVLETISKLGTMKLEWSLFFFCRQNKNDPVGGIRNNQFNFRKHEASQWWGRACDISHDVLGLHMQAHTAMSMSSLTKLPILLDSLKNPLIEAYRVPQCALYYSKIWIKITNIKYIEPNFSYNREQAKGKKKYVSVMTNEGVLPGTDYII